MNQLHADIKKYQEEVEKTLAKCRFPQYLEGNVPNSGELLNQV
jgi:hypothetical protein